MAWISVHEQVKDHPKTRELSRVLPCTRHEAIGILVTLWLWGVNNADENGHILSATAQDIADGIMYHGLSRGQSAGHLADCLIQTGWLDVDKDDGHYILHDWDEWQEQWYKALARRHTEAERKREQRKKDAMSHGQSAGPAQHNRNRNRNRNQTVTPPEQDNDKAYALCPAGRTADLPSEIISFLNLTCGTNYRASSDKTKRHINARLNEGYTLDDFKSVILKKHAEWHNDPAMSKYLRPETLFGTKFESYLNQRDTPSPQTARSALAELYHEAREDEQYDPE